MGYQYDHIENKKQIVSDKMVNVEKNYRAPEPMSPSVVFNEKNASTPPPQQEMDGFSYLSCVYTNADCLISKFNEFKEKVLEGSPHVIAIVETALQSTPTAPRYCPDEYLLISGYQMIRQDNETDIKGGILIYIRDDIHVT